MAMRANTIEEAISIMDDIVYHSVYYGDRFGFFTSLYRATTIVVKEHCDRGDFFEDNDRLRYLDVIFANRYFEAYEAYKNKGKPTQAWKVAFDSTKRNDILILQQLLVGMNAHISLDLGIATAEVSDGKISESLRRDFFRLNNLLAGMVDLVQDEIGVVSPLLKYLDWLFLRFDEAFISYGITVARDNALNFAEELVTLPKNQWEYAIARRDQSVADISRVLGSTKWFLRPAIWLVSLAENDDPRKITEALSDEKWQQTIQLHLSDIIKEAKKQGIDLSKRETKVKKIVDL